MAVYRRKGSEKYHIDFVFKGKRHQKSSGTSNKRAAEQIEAKWKIDLARGIVGLIERPPAPTLKDFSFRFNKHVEILNEQKPKTVKFYAQQVKRLLEYHPLANARLDEIDESLIEAFVHHRVKKVKVSTVNRALATLRKLLRFAHEWKLIDRVPRIRLLPGEQNREFVLSYAQEKVYLEFAPQPLNDLATVILDTGLRVGEALSLVGQDVTLAPDDAQDRLGTVFVKVGKSRNARRHVALTARARDVLRRRSLQAGSGLLFKGEGEQPLLVTSLDHLHLKTRRKLKLPEGFVLHALRHTFLTRLGEAGADAFVIKKVAGHHSITVSQRYVHPNDEAVERAVARLEALNERFRRELADQQSRCSTAPGDSLMGD